MQVRDGEADDADCGADTDIAIADEPGVDTLTDCETADTVPETELTKTPPDRTRKRRAKFEFESPTAGVTGFECKLDDADFAACTSPKVFTGLSREKHKFQVRAIDDNGDRDPTPAKFSWKIKN